MGTFNARFALAALLFCSLALAESHNSEIESEDDSEASYSTATPEWAQTLTQNKSEPRQPSNSTPLDAQKKLEELRIEAGKVMSEEINSSECIERICRTLKQIQTEIAQIHSDQLLGKTAEERAEYLAELSSDELDSLLKFAELTIARLESPEETKNLAASKRLVSDFSQLKQDIEKAIKPTAEQIRTAKSVLEKNGVKITPTGKGEGVEFAFEDIKAFQAKIGVGDPDLVKALNTLRPGLGNELARNTLEGEAFNRYVAAAADKLNKKDRAILSEIVPHLLKQAESGTLPKAIPASLRPAIETLAKAAQFEKNIGKENLTEEDRLALTQARGLAYDQLFNNPIVQAGKLDTYRATLDRANELSNQIDTAIEGTEAKNQVRIAQATRSAVESFNKLIVGDKAAGDLPLDELIAKASKAAAFYIDPTALKVSRENQFTPVLEGRLKALEDTAKGLKLRGGSPELVETLQKTTQDIRNAFVERKTQAAEQYAKDAKSAVISAGVGIATLGAGSVLAGTFKVASGSFALATAAQGTAATATAAAALTTRQIVTQGATRLVVGGTAGAAINGTLASAGNIARSYDNGENISLASAGREGLAAARDGAALGAGLSVLPRPVQQAAGVYFSSRMGGSAVENLADGKLASAGVDLAGAYAVPAAIERLAKIGRPKDTAYTAEELASLKEIIPKLEAQRGQSVNPSEYASILERSRNLKQYTSLERDVSGPQANERLNEAGLLFSGKNTDPVNKMTEKANPTGRPKNLHVVLSDTITRLGNLDKLSQLPYEQLVERVGTNVRENYNPPKNPMAVEALAKAGADYIKSLSPLGDSRFRIVERSSASGPLTLSEAQTLLASKVEGGLKSTTISANEGAGFLPNAPSEALVAYEIPKGTKGVLINGAGPVAQTARAEQASRGNLGFAQNEVAVNIRSGSLKVGEIKTIVLADGRTAYTVKLVPSATPIGTFAPRAVPVLERRRD